MTRLLIGFQVADAGDEFLSGGWEHSGKHSADGCRSK